MHFTCPPALVFLALSAAMPLAAAQPAPDCRAIAAATVAELRAGYEGWSEEAEQLARAAAGSACVKAYLAAPSAASSRDGLSSTAVRAPGESSAADVAANAAAAADRQAAGEENNENKEDEANGERASKAADDAWNPFSDIKFNKVSARPGKKPYERRRESNENDQ